MNSIKKVKENALKEHVPIIMDETLNKIIEISGENRFDKILEIGTAVGYSSLCFLSLLNADGRIDTIERDEEMIKQAKENFNDLDKYNQINLFEGDAVEILPTLNDKYDMIFIDASKGKYPFFLEQSLRLLSDNGIIFADNILYKGYVMSDYNKHKQRTAVTHLREYIKNATENEKLNTIIYEVGDGLAVSFFKNNSKYILKS